MPSILHLLLGTLPALLATGAATALLIGLARGRRGAFDAGLGLLVAAAAVSVVATLAGWPAWRVAEFADGYSAGQALRHRDAGLLSALAALLAGAVAWRIRRRVRRRGGVTRGFAIIAAGLAVIAAATAGWATLSGFAVRRPELRPARTAAGQPPVERGIPRVGGGPPPQE